MGDQARRRIYPIYVPARFGYGVPNYLNTPQQLVSNSAGLVLRDFLMEGAAFTLTCFENE